MSAIKENVQLAQNTKRSDSLICKLNWCLQLLQHAGSFSFSNLRCIFPSPLSLLMLWIQQSIKIQNSSEWIKWFMIHPSVRWHTYPVGATYIIRNFFMKSKFCLSFVFLHWSSLVLKLLQCQWLRFFHCISFYYIRSLIYVSQSTKLSYSSSHMCAFSMQSLFFIVKCQIHTFLDGSVSWGEAWMN